MGSQQERPDDTLQNQITLSLDVSLPPSQNANKELGRRQGGAEEELPQMPIENLSSIMGGTLIQAERDHAQET